MEKVSCYHGDNSVGYYGYNTHNLVAGDEGGNGEGEDAVVRDHSKHVPRHGHCY